ncbi:MAG: aldose 1-epimerase family protein [Spirochaetales bacterium]|nr:aldose 1-epimerase family protein [Spirochaetales bacterium]
MAEYLGRSWSKNELVSRIGDPRQIAGATPFIMSEGKAEGVRAVRVDTGGGLEFTLLPGRGMDIAGASFRGRALSFLSGTGITSPAYYEEPGLGFLRGFYAGLLTTCGITNVGAPSVDQGEAFGLHGRVANAGAEDLAVDHRWEGDEYLISVKGVVREARALFENLTLTRRVQTRLGSRGFTLDDLIENRGFREEPLLMLYHFNFGFPLLGPGARVVGPIAQTLPRDEAARSDRGVEEALQYPEPQPEYAEKVFFHTLRGDERGRTFVALLNRDVGDGTPLGVVLRFDLAQLPLLTQWKMPCQGFYVLGLEPGNAPPIGRGPLREQGRLPMLAGQASYPVHIEFEVLDTLQGMEQVEREAARLAAS